ncbi:hypothetical protein L227DRAFT_616713 [Lentinus tigrinus ALCF2SS1-6]|uniref:Uncharacterized protein n=1 Tax=Lentinus tigrinus ALCF2SS1-6 TaxID=1328759 RepID=A0A5C2RTD4_9APHY|nr:hypothetical protein L227DRAFT_616713 [Lentinus tigrinus ALCF2SS1-6]
MRSSRLEEELSVALDDVRDAEEEIKELRPSHHGVGPARKVRLETSSVGYERDIIDEGVTSSEAEIEREMAEDGRLASPAIASTVPHLVSGAVPATGASLVPSTACSRSPSSIGYRSWSGEGLPGVLVRIENFRLVILDEPQGQGAA